MAWELSEREFEEVLGLAAPKQFQYFVERCVEHGEVWGLAVDGADWGMTQDVNGLDLFAVWPHRRFAEACRHLHWAHRHPTALRLDDFLDMVIPKLIADVVGVAVFPLPNLHCTAVDARQLQGALEMELMRAL